MPPGRGVPTTGAQLRGIWAPGSTAPRRRPLQQKKAPKKKIFDPAKRNDAFEACYRGTVVPEAEVFRRIEPGATRTRAAHVVDAARSHL